MAITSIQMIRHEAAQFRGVFGDICEYEATYDPDSVGSNATVRDTIATPGAEMGDLVLVSVTADLQGLILVGNVSSADVVTLTLANTSAGAINIGSCSIHLVCMSPYHVLG